MGQDQIRGTFYQMGCGSSFSFFVVVTLLENLKISTNTSLWAMFQATLINSAQIFSLGNIFILSDQNTNGFQSLITRSVKHQYWSLEWVGFMCNDPPENWALPLGAVWLLRTSTDFVFIGDCQATVCLLLQRLFRPTRDKKKSLIAQNCWGLMVQVTDY